MLELSFLSFVCFNGTKTLAISSAELLTCEALSASFRMHACILTVAIANYSTAFPYVLAIYMHVRIIIRMYIYNLYVYMHLGVSIYKM